LKKLESLFIKLNIGINTYEPVSAPTKELRFNRLVNLEARKGSLAVSRGIEKITNINEKFNTFSHYTNDSNTTFLYAFSDEGLYKWDTTLSTFDSTPLDTFTANVDEPWAVVGSEAGLFYTRHGVPLATVVNETITSVNSYEAKYAINAHDHLLLANFNEVSGAYVVRWSDLYHFDDFVATTTNEADEYTFNASYGEITGLSIQRDVVYVYTERSVFTVTYIGMPDKYVLSPLFTDLGARFHHSVVSHRDVDYFIGDDNFYRLEGTILTPIGDSVWDFFKDSSASFSYGTEIRGVVDTERDRVGWLYTRIYDATYPNGLRASKKYWIWYNVKEQRWWTEEADFISFYKPKKRLFFYDTIDSQAQIIDTETRLIDGLWQATGFLYEGGLYGGEDESIYSTSLGYDGKVLHFETSEIHLDAPSTTKTLSQVCFYGEIGGSNIPFLDDKFLNVVVSIGYRNADSSLTWVALSASNKRRNNTMEYDVPDTVPASRSYAVRFTHANTDGLYITNLIGINLIFNTPNNAKGND
jgi:hypothetical protein